jgi:hypothetical protein
VSGGLLVGVIACYGGVLLPTWLVAELHGTRWVAGSALAFALGSLLAPLAVARLERPGGRHGRRLGLRPGQRRRPPRLRQRRRRRPRPRVIAEAGIGWLGAALATGLATLALSRLARRWSRSAVGRVVGVAGARDL